jgi:ATPase subunit of ABC transporter with duplicated ATPase domains
MLSKMMLFRRNVLLFDHHKSSRTGKHRRLEQRHGRLQGEYHLTTHDHQMIQTVANRIIEFTDSAPSLTEDDLYDISG